MTPWNGNIFRFTGPLCEEITGHRWFPHKDQWRRALMFSLICAWTKGSVNNRNAGDFRCHRAHYDVVVMNGRVCISPAEFHMIPLTFYGSTIVPKCYENRNTVVLSMASTEPVARWLFMKLSRFMSSIYVYIIAELWKRPNQRITSL